jgi:hypothetical protein
MSARAEILRKLGEYRGKLRESFPYPEKRIALLQLLRCIDYKSFVEYIYERAGKEVPQKDEAHKVSRLFNWGWNQALSLFWGTHVNQSGIPLFQTVQELKDWGDSLLQSAGRVRLIELVLELERLQLGRLTAPERSGGTYDFYLVENATGVEGAERLDGNHFNVLLRRIHEKDRVWEELERRRGAIMDKMATMVEPFEKHYIRYDAEPQVDEYYHDLSSALAPTRNGWDAFPQQTLFGGIPFAKYIDCVRVLMGFALKHLDFCVLLGNKNTAINPINTVTVPCTWLNACRYMSYALEIPEAESEQLMLTTSITPENAEHHFSTPSGPFASHYMIGKGSAVRLITGCLDNPFHFMLRELRRKFSDDWDRSVDCREPIFRGELIALLSRYGQIVSFSDSIDITTDAGKTDIDTFAFDPVAKVAGLFQLKWQEQFAGSMRERESRKSNFLKTGNSWIEKVSNWIESGRMPQTLVSLGMPKHLANAINQTRLFVIGRNFSHFSGEFQTDPRAAWGTWSQLLRLTESPRDGESPLTTLFDLIRLDSPVMRSKHSGAREELEVDGLRLVIHPYKATDLKGTG